jgi:hypothetical protein
MRVSGGHPAVRVQRRAAPPAGDAHVRAVGGTGVRLAAAVAAALARNVAGRLFPVGLRARLRVRRRPRGVGGRAAAPHRARPLLRAGHAAAAGLGQTQRAIRGLPTQPRPPPRVGKFRPRKFSPFYRCICVERAPLSYISRAEKLSRSTVFFLLMCRFSLVK